MSASPCRAGYGFVVGTRTIITLHDDLDGTDAEETMIFSLVGTDYEIDLNSTHIKELRNALRPFVAAARTVKRPSTPRSRGTRNSKIRAWAKENGINVAARGTISAQVLERYKAAH